MCAGDLHTVTAQDFEGFIEPFRKIELASDESGAIAELIVEEGQFVEQGQPMARMDDRLQKIQLKIAKQVLESVSQLEVAREGYDKRIAIKQKLAQLRQEGHASESELIRADMELSIAKGRYLAAQEETIVRELEQERAAVQLQRRTITAPINGVVTKIHRRQGEYLSPVNPDLLTLIQIDQLIAKFNIPAELANSFEVGKAYSLHLNNDKTVLAVVYSISVEVDAESETVEVKMVIDNSGYQIRSGEKISLSI